MMIDFPKYNFRFELEDGPEETARKLIEDLMRGDLMIAIFEDDLHRILDGRMFRLAEYEFTSPLQAKELARVIDKGSTVLFGVYGDIEGGLLGMKIFLDVVRAIDSQAGLSHGAPIPAKFEDQGRIRVTMLISR